MGEYVLNFTGSQIDSAVGQVVSNTATNGQVLTANGQGGATWQNATGGSDPALESAKATGGIGYKTITQNVTWDGDTTGKVILDFMHCYQVSTTVADISEYASGKITMIYEGEPEEYDIEETGGVQPMMDNLYALCEGIVIIATTDVVFEEMPIAKGIYFYGSLEEETSQCDSYVSKIECGTTNKINSQYITRDSLLSSAVDGQGIGYVEDTATITWDGDITGKEVCLSNYYKVSTKSISADYYLEGRLIKYEDYGEETHCILKSDITYLDDAHNLYKILDYVVVANADTSYSGSTITKGVYFCKYGNREFTSELNYGGTLHKISSAFVEDAGSSLQLKTINNQSITGTGNFSLQEILTSGTNIKTINNESILGEGNLTVSGLPASAPTGSALIYKYGEGWTTQTGYGYTYTPENADDTNEGASYVTFNKRYVPNIFVAGTGINISSHTVEDYTIKTTGVEYTDGGQIQDNALKFVKCTQTYYNSITPDNDTLYIIVG